MIGNRIIQLREERGWSQDKLASIVNVSRVTISRYENNQRDVNQKMMIKLANAFGISPQDFYIEKEQALPFDKARQDFIDKIMAMDDDTFNRYVQLLELFDAQQKKGKQ